MLHPEERKGILDFLREYDWIAQVSQRHPSDEFVCYCLHQGLRHPYKDPSEGILDLMQVLIVIPSLLVDRGEGDLLR